MNQYEIDIRVKGGFPASNLWQTIIAQWVQNNKDYLEENNFNDAAYWHNEMANISCLVGAIWKIGGVAISEYTINKDTYCTNGAITKFGQNNNGRTDLYFAKDKIKYLIESKYVRQDTITCTEITKEMCCALKDCRSCKETELENKMAMVFVAPNTKQTIEFNDQKLDYDIKVMLKVVGAKKPTYKDNENKSDDKVYDTIYLFGQYFTSIDEECENKKCPKDH